ncbi:cupin domain-containing protein [Herbihabitans rhizosphaerae]|uniref:cupin domain-containing protein n=1 Tax=Herbihabitans rhizosphaerae TaxID=1872711 RepID=UPI0013EE7BD0|nr:cupin domain-containing protein [Herbihabitans rhizosphaerae]
MDPGAHSPVDKHAVTECWLASTGTARMTLGDEELTLTPGDIIAIAPHVPHQVFNESDDDFVFFSVWWDANKEQAVEAGEG